jgi:hypothetical protein
VYSKENVGKLKKQSNASQDDVCVVQERERKLPGKVKYKVCYHRHRAFRYPEQSSASMGLLLLHHDHDHSFICPFHATIAFHHIVQKRVSD